MGTRWCISPTTILLCPLLSATLLSACGGLLTGWRKEWPFSSARKEQWPREVAVLVEGHSETVGWDWKESGLGGLRKWLGNAPSAGDTGSLAPGIVNTCVHRPKAV